VHAKRRRLLVLAAALGAAPPLARAQRTYRIGILDPGNAPRALREPYWRIVLERLHELGYEEGKNLAVDMHLAAGERLSDVVRQMVQTSPDVIVVSSTPGVRAVMGATKTIPIVFPTAGNPVGTGLVQSLARPGGNVTGQSLIGTDTAAKRIELLLELAPHARRLGFMGPAANAAVSTVSRELGRAAEAKGLELRHLDASSEEAIEREFERFSAEPVDALIVSAILVNRKELLADLAMRRRLPAIYFYMEHVEAGGLVSFGPDLRVIYRRTAEYVHRILQGARPADMPVEQVRFSIGVNLRAAKAIGVTVPQSLLLRADRVIQ
jgi:putative ABC transport system substrate-binding protein